VAAGVLTLALVAGSRFGLARGSAALAVAAIVAGWAFAQEPRFLPGLTISQAAAGRSTLIALLIAVVAGAVILVPSLALLFHLFLHGHLVPATEPAPALPDRGRAADARPGRPLAPLTGVSLLVGVVLMVLLDGSWAHVVGVLCLFVAAASGFVIAATAPDDAAP
jgi:cytochrome d ubiquinol oxidase subunit II